MKPADCKWKLEAVAAAHAVIEARVVVGRFGLPLRDETRIDDALHRLELSFWRRAEELSKPAARGKRRKR